MAAQPRQQPRGQHMLARVGMLSALALVSIGGAAQALDQVTFGTNWKAQAEHGGFYQAVATGIYEKHGLDVTIRQGGP
jgi:NitT/TauT family transport system substrate-binding protein